MQANGGVRPPAAEHYDNAFAMLQNCHVDAPPESITRMNNILEVIAEIGLGILRAEMLRLEHR